MIKRKSDLNSCYYTYLNPPLVPLLFLSFFPTLHIRVCIHLFSNSYSTYLPFLHLLFFLTSLSHFMPRLAYKPYSGEDFHEHVYVYSFSSIFVLLLSSLPSPHFHFSSLLYLLFSYFFSVSSRSQTGTKLLTSMKSCMLSLFYIFF